MAHACTHKHTSGFYRIKFRENHLSSPLLFKSVRSKIQRTTILTTVSNWWKTWPFSLRKGSKLKVFDKRVPDGVSALNICIPRASDCMTAIYYVLPFLHIMLRTPPQIYQIRTKVLIGWQPNLACIIEPRANNSAPSCTKRNCDKEARPALLKMGIMMPETCWANGLLINHNLLHLVGLTRHFI